MTLYKTRGLTGCWELRKAIEPLTTAFEDIATTFNECEDALKEKSQVKRI